MMDELVRKQDVIDVIHKEWDDVLVFDESGSTIADCCEEVISNLPSIESMTIHEVAIILAELFDDPCACNYNGIDEWLPEKCKFGDVCPHPEGVSCWEQYLKYQLEKIRE